MIYLLDFQLKERIENKLKLSFNQVLEIRRYFVLLLFTSTSWDAHSTLTPRSPIRYHIFMNVL